MAVYCMSDIHGHLKPLQECLEKVQFRPGKDELYLLGDYIDWGQDSIDVLQFLMFLQKNDPRHIHCLMGNHEDLMLQTLVNFRMDIADVWLNGNRGDHTLAEYQMLSEQEKNPDPEFSPRSSLWSRSGVRGQKVFTCPCLSLFSRSG